ncbi:hypothetical protein MTO96_028160 [Rhipicephalus appendiculatus]
MPFQVISEKFNLSKTFKAHKLLLALSSEAFEVMFYGENLANKAKPYVYAGKPCLVNCEEALHTKAAAEKYQLPELAQDCEAYICCAFTPKGICSVLDFALDCGYAVPEREVNALLSGKSEAVLSSEAFIKSSVKTVHRVLDKVHNVQELFVVRAVLKWAHAHRQKLLKMDRGSESADVATIFSQFRSKLRFLALSPAEFLEFVTAKEARGVMEAADAFAILSNLIKAGCVEPTVLGVRRDRAARDTRCQIRQRRPLLLLRKRLQRIAAKAASFVSVEPLDKASALLRAQPPIFGLTRRPVLQIGLHDYVSRPNGILNFLEMVGGLVLFSKMSDDRRISKAVGLLSSSACSFGVSSATMLMANIISPACAYYLPRTFYYVLFHGLGAICYLGSAFSVPRPRPSIFRTIARRLGIHVGLHDYVNRTYGVLNILEIAGALVLFRMTSSTSDPDSKAMFLLSGSAATFGVNSAFHWGGLGISSRLFPNDVRRNVGCFTGGLHAVHCAYAYYKEHVLKRDRGRL